MTERLHSRVRELVSELTESAPPAPPFPTPETVAVPPRRPRSRVLVAAVIAIALIAGAIGVVAATGRNDNPTKPITTVPVPTPAAGAAAIAYVANDGLFVEGHRIVASNDIIRPRWSPDGRELAYEHAGGLWIVARDGRSPHRIADAPDRWEWSPAGRWIGAIKGQDVTILDTSANGAVNRTEPNATDFGWTPDGRLAYSAHRGALHDQLYWVDPNDFTAVGHLYALDIKGDQYGLLLDRFAPDGSPLLTVDAALGSSSVVMDSADLAVVRNGHATIVGHMFLQRSWAQWSRDGRLAFVETGGRMVTDSRAVTVCTATLRCHAITGNRTQTLEPSFSPDGRLLAFVRNDASTDPSQFVHGGEPDWRPRYAQRTLWIANADGTNQRKLHTKATGVGVPTWLSNRTLLFTLDDGTLVTIDVQSGAEHVVGQLATRGQLPPSDVYDPTDANRQLQWTDLFAVAPTHAATPAPAPTTIADVAPTAPTATPAPEWIGKQFTIASTSNHDVMVENRAVGAYWGDPYAAGGPSPTYGGLVVATVAPNGDHVTRSLFWLYRRPPGARSAAAGTVLDSIAIEVPPTLYLSICQPRDKKEDSVLAVVSSLADRVVVPGIKAWTADPASGHITELNPKDVFCRFVAG